MALRFGQCLDPEGRFGREALSPLSHDFSGLAPIYLQTGGREILTDMICGFAETQAKAGADIMLDVWPSMPHDFQSFDGTRPEAKEALARIAQAVRHAVEGDAVLSVGTMTRLVSGRFRTG